MVQTYIYFGDRWTDPKYVGAMCRAVLRPDGKTIRGKNGNMLVEFGTEQVVVLGRRLRKVQPI